MKRILRHYLTWLVVGLGLANALVLTRLDPWHVGSAFVGVYTLVVPGLLLLAFLAKKKLPLLMGLTISVALSLVVLMGVGTGVSLLFSHLGVAQPLRLHFLLPALDLTLVLLLVLSALFKRTLPLDIPIFGRLDWTVAGGALLMPVLAVLGATSLNNGGTNAFTIVSLSLVATYVPLLVVLKKRLNVAVMPIVLYMMALALLLMNSMRGWLITGHDVLREYHVFQMTAASGRWDIASFRDPYNACLSLTVLPTYLQSLLHIDGAYIYKFVFQFIAALPVISIFYLFQRYATAAIAFLAAFTYISFPPFMVDMAMLNRQSIGYLFFGTFLYVLLASQFATKKRRIVLMVLLGAGMIVSHYSTTYVALSLLVIGYFVSLVLRSVFGRKGRVSKLGALLRVRKLPNRIIYSRPALLSLPIVVALVLMAVLWTGPATQTAQGITKTFKKIGATLSTPSQQQVQDAGTSGYGLVAGAQSSKDKLFTQFVQDAISTERTPAVESNLFPLAQVRLPQYKTVALDEPALPITGLGSFVSKFMHLNLGSFFSFAKDGYAKVLQLLLIVGLIAMLIGYRFGEFLMRRLPTEYVALCVAALLMLGFQVLFPSSIPEYGVLRLFQQGLTLLALPIVLGFMMLLGLLVHKSTPRLLTYGAVLVVFFGILSGLVPQLTGGGRAALSLNNSGLYYEAYSTHAEELASFMWLKSVADPKQPLQSDRYFTALKLAAYDDLISSGSKLLPETIKRNSFVLLSTTNVTKGYIIEYQDGAIIYYSTPTQFLNDDKNLVYSTGASSIYR